MFCVCWRFSAVQKNGLKNIHQILCKNGIKCSETLDILKVAYGECTVSQNSVYKWYKLFTEDREEMNDDAHPGRPSTSTTNENTEAVKKNVMENRRITIREVAEDVGISVRLCHAIFSDILGLKRVVAKFVPKFLNFDLLTRHCLFVIMPQSPYSPDLAPCDFFLFPRLKRPMKGRRFATIQDIKTESLRELKDIPKSAY